MLQVCLFVFSLRKVTMIVRNYFGYNYITVHTSCLVHDGGRGGGKRKGG